MIVSYIQISRLNVEPMTVEVLSCLSSSPQTLYTADSYGGTSLFWGTKPKIGFVCSSPPVMICVLLVPRLSESMGTRLGVVEQSIIA